MEVFHEVDLFKFALMGKVSDLEDFGVFIFEVKRLKESLVFPELGKHVKVMVQNHAVVF